MKTFHQVVNDGTVCIPERFYGRDHSVSFLETWCIDSCLEYVPICWERTWALLNTVAVLNDVGFLYFVCTSSLPASLKLLVKRDTGLHLWFLYVWFDSQTLCHLSSPKTGRDSLHFVDAEMKQSSRQVENETDEKVLEARGTVFQGGCVRRDRLCKRLQINHFIWKLAGLRNGNAVVILTGAVTYWRHGAESLVGVESRENGRSSCQEASTDTPF